MDPPIVRSTPPELPEGRQGLVVFVAGLFGAAQVLEVRIAQQIAQLHVRDARIQPVVNRRFRACRDVPVQLRRFLQIHQCCGLRARQGQYVRAAPAGLCQCPQRIGVARRNRPQDSASTIARP